MISLYQYIIQNPIKENFKFKINRNSQTYSCQPRNWNQLSVLLKERYDEFGPGTKDEPVNLNDIDVSMIQNFNCTSLSSNYGIFEFNWSKNNYPFEWIDVSNWNMSNAKDISCMFYGNKLLKGIGDLSNWY